MKIKWNTALENILYFAFILFVVLQIVPMHFTGSRPWVGSVYNNLKPIDPIVPDTISYRDHKRIQDSIINRRLLKNGEFGYSPGVTIGCVGITSCIQCDTCSIEWASKQLNNDVGKNLHGYLILPGWQIFSAANENSINVNDSVKFHVEQGQPYIRKAVKTSFKLAPNDLMERAVVIDVPVKFMYNEKQKAVMIPVGHTVKQIFTIVFYIAFILVFVYSLYLLMEFFLFVVDLSKGLVFTDENIRRLKLISLTLLFCPAIVYLSDWLMKFIFRSYFTDDVVMKSDIWSDSWKTIVAGIVFVLLDRAFRQGKKLKDEHDLTV